MQSTMHWESVLWEQTILSGSQWKERRISCQLVSERWESWLRMVRYRVVQSATAELSVVRH
jgi:hypothetical protein